jgi:hypothetical protein
MQLVAFRVRADLSVAAQILPCLVRCRHRAAIRHYDDRADRARADEAMPPELSPLNEAQLVVAYFTVLWFMRWSPPSKKLRTSCGTRRSLLLSTARSELGSTVSFLVKAALVLRRGDIAGVVIAAMLFEAEVLKRRAATTRARSATHRHE